jgi:hypothetical protein
MGVMVGKLKSIFAIPAIEARYARAPPAADQRRRRSAPR